MPRNSLVPSRSYRREVDLFGLSYAVGLIPLLVTDALGLGYLSAVLFVVVFVAIWLLGAITLRLGGRGGGK
jgi:hypothetical protein